MPRNASPAALRREAEARLARAFSREAKGTLFGADLVRSHHELQVHQIELELQNEALQNALAAAEAGRHFGTLFDFAPIGYFRLDAAGVIREVNLAGAELLGCTRTQAVEQLLASFCLASERQRLAAFLGQVFASEGRQTHELVLSGGPGPPVIGQLDASRIPGEEGCLVSMTDITARKQLEEQLRQAQKLEALNRLAGGVAHDFNNILTVIEGHLFRIQQSRERPGDVEEAVVEMRAATRRAASLTRQLLAFSCRQSLQPAVLDLHEVVRSMAHLLRRIIGDDVSMELRLCEHEALVLADASMLEQVVLNLSLNARDAMPEGGQLFIETALVDFDSAITSSLPQARAGAFVRLTFRDTGAGIPAHVLPRIFEPFFTTKEQGRGSGLGLATVHGMVQQHEGWISVDSERGRGTTFGLYLPRQRALQVAPPEVPEALPVLPGTETVLVVEDEPFIRRLLGYSLELNGYRVLVAESAPRALEQWREHGSEIRLLITDVVMPGGMSGIALGEQLSREAPELGVIYISGYSPDVGLKGEAPSNSSYLPKPFTIEQLLHVVRKTLDHSSV